MIDLMKIAVRVFCVIPIGLKDPQRGYELNRRMDSDDFLAGQAEEY
jgi:hypothetical protein